MVAQRATAASTSSGEHRTPAFPIDVLFCWDFTGSRPGVVRGRASGLTKEGAVSVRLFIGNLPYAATEADLREHLSSVGAPAQVVLPVDRETGRPRGFAFVDYTDRAVAEEAIRRFNQQPFKGRPLAVSEARPREERRTGRPETGWIQRPRPGARAASAVRGRAGSRRDRVSRRRPRGGAGPRSRNFGPDAPPKNKRKPPRKDGSRPRRAQSRSGPSAGSTTPTRTGAHRTRTSTSTTSRRAPKTTKLVTEDELDDEQE